MTARKGRWSAKLARPIAVKGGPVPRTLADAGRFISEVLLEPDQHRQASVSAVELLMEAAERGGSVEDATRQVERALFLQARWIGK